MCRWNHAGEVGALLESASGWLLLIESAVLDVVALFRLGLPTTRGDSDGSGYHILSWHVMASY